MMAKDVRQLEAYILLLLASAPFHKFCNAH